MAARRASPAASSAQVERVALYSRVSSEDQADTETIQVQVEFLRRYAELHGLHVVDEYLDDGVSGTIPLEDRPAGARLVADARAGRLSTVIFYRVSRLGRRLAVVLGAYEQLDASGVVVRSATEPIDTALPIGRFIFQMLAAFAELDRETILDNTSRGRARGAKDGRWYGVVPTGYTVQDGKLAPNDREILPGVPEADLVRDIYQRIADGESSIKVAELLSARGLSRFKRYARHDGREVVIEGAPGWPAKRVSELIRNPTYKGEHTFNGRHGDVVREVPALVSTDLWERAVSQLAKNRIFPLRNGENFYLLRTMIRCASCQVAYVGTTVGEGRRYYRCGYARPGGDRGLGPGKQCRSKLLDANAIEGAVWADCEAFIRNPDDAVDEALAQMVQERPPASDPSTALAHIREQLAAKAGERTDVLTLMRRRAISVDEAEQQLAAIEAEQHALRAEAARLDAQHKAFEVGRQQLLMARDLLIELRRRLDEGLDNEIRRTVVHALVRRIEVTTEMAPVGKGRGKRRMVRQARVRAQYVFRDESAVVIDSCSSGEPDHILVTREWVMGDARRGDAQRHSPTGT